MSEKKPLLKLVIDNHRTSSGSLKPRQRRKSKVSPYCPECQGSTWFPVKQGRADYSDKLAITKRCCVYCLAKGKVTVW